MDISEFRKRGKEMVDFIADYIETVRGRKVLPDVHPGFLIQQLPNHPPKHPEPWKDIMEDVENLIVPGLYHFRHPSCHAYYPINSSLPSVLGDFLDAGFGCIGPAWECNPAGTELQMMMMDWLAEMIGLPEEFKYTSGIGGGTLLGTASEAMLVCLVAARQRALSYLKQMYPKVSDGDLCSKMMGYCSTMTHRAAVKAGRIAGIKFRIVECDDKYSLRGQTLATAMQEDKKRGMFPMFVCATIGTTPVCSHDNLEEIGPVCEREKAWLYVDAAYAGTALVCPEFQYLLKGVEYIDSFDFNPYKMMLTTIYGSALWVRNKKELQDALTEESEYLPDNDQIEDFRHWSVELGQGFRSLKVWMVIRAYGISGIQEHVRKQVRLAKLFEKLVKQDARFEVLGEVNLGLVCFRLKGSNDLNHRLLDAVTHTRMVSMIGCELKGKFVIRFVVTAESTDDDVIRRDWNIIKHVANRLILKIEGDSSLLRKQGHRLSIQRRRSSFEVLGSTSSN